MYSYIFSIRILWKKKFFLHRSFKTMFFYIVIYRTKPNWVKLNWTFLIKKKNETKLNWMKLNWSWIELKIWNISTKKGLNTKLAFVMILKKGVCLLKVSRFFISVHHTDGIVRETKLYYKNYVCIFFAFFSTIVGMFEVFWRIVS